MLDGLVGCSVPFTVNRLFRDGTGIRVVMLSYCQHVSEVHQEVGLVYISVCIQMSDYAHADSNSHFVFLG